ncbi:hypothetical protein D3C83_315510 [compost metagenome]
MALILPPLAIRKLIGMAVVLNVFQLSPLESTAYNMLVSFLSTEYLAIFASGSLKISRLVSP